MGSSDESDDPEGEYKVEAILESRQIKGRTQYLIKWDGYSSSENTWEPVEHLSGAKLLLARFKGEQRRKIVQKRQRPAAAASEAAAARKPKQKKLAAQASSDPPDESAAARPRKPPSASAGGKAAAPCGGLALPPRWRCRPSRDGTSRWTWTDPKGRVYRTAEAARVAVARWEKQLGAADDSKRGRPAKAGKPAPPEARAHSAGGGGGSSGGGEGSEVRCCCCGQISLGGALTVTVAGGEPVCRRCSTLLLDGVGMAATGPQLDATMARLGLAPASTGAAGAHRANDAGGAGTSSGAPPAAKAKHSILGVRWERCEQKTEREVREVVSSMLASLERAHAPKKKRKPASKPAKVEVVLPLDAQPGQKLLLSLRGQQLVFEVPANAHGGLRLSVNLPESFGVSKPIRARCQPIAAPREMPVTASPSKQSREQECSRECSKVLQRVLKQVEKEHILEEARDRRTEQEVKAVMQRMVAQLEKTQQRTLEKQAKQRAKDLEKAAKQRAKDQAREEAKRRWAEVQQVQEREQRIKREVSSVLNAIISHLERNEQAKAHAAERARQKELHRPPQQRKKAPKQLQPPAQPPQQTPQLPQRTPQLPQQPPQRTAQLPQHAPNFSGQPPHLGQNPLQQLRQQSPQQRHKAPQQAQQVRRQQQQQPFENRSEEQLLLEQRLQHLQHLQHLQRREDERRQQRALLEQHLKDLPRQQEQLHHLQLQRDEQAPLEQLRQLQSAAATLPLAPLEQLEPSQLQLVRQQLLQLQAVAVHTPQQAAQLQLLHAQMLRLVQSQHDEAARRGGAPLPSDPAATLTPRKRKDRAHGRVQPMDRLAEESGSSANAAQPMSAGSHPAKKRKERKHHKSPKELGSVRSDGKRPVQYPRVVFKLAQPSEHHEEESAEEDVKCFQLHEEQGGRLGCLLPAHHEGEHMRLGKRKIVKPTILADE